ACCSWVSQGSKTCLKAVAISVLCWFSCASVVCARVAESGRPITLKLHGSAPMHGSVLVATISLRTSALVDSVVQHDCGGTVGACEDGASGVWISISSRLVGVPVMM